MARSDCQPYVLAALYPYMKKERKKERKKGKKREEKKERKKTLHNISSAV
jgi:hypothetical protein